MHKVQVTKLSPIETGLDINFRFENIHVYTIGYAEYIKQWNNGRKSKHVKEDSRFLVFSAQCEIEEYDSLTAADVVTRPEFLGVLGILTFFTGESFTVFQFNQLRNFAINEFWPMARSNRFVYYGDKSKALEKLAEFLTAASPDSRALVFSALDRYRKACYLVKENDDSLVYSDESFLAYFHVLELLAAQFQNTLKNKVVGTIKSFVDELLSDVFQYSEMRKESEMNNKQRLIEQLFTQDIPVSVKICHMYRELKMFNGKSRQIIEGFVKFRNDIAHGRAVFNRQLLFPLPPFFQQVKEIDKEIGMMSLVAARTIDSYLNTGLYTVQWNRYLKRYPAPLDEIKVFLKEKRYEQITSTQFQKGAVFDISPWMLSYYYYYRKIQPRDFEAAMAAVMLPLTFDRKSIKAFLEPAILLSDSQNVMLRDKSRQLVELAFSKKYANMRARDYLKEFENRFALPWFKSFVAR